LPLRSRHAKADCIGNPNGPAGFFDIVSANNVSAAKNSGNRGSKAAFQPFIGFGIEDLPDKRFARRAYQERMSHGRQRRQAS
jgi:hypothetical protein